MKKESNIISSIYEKVLNYSPETGIRLDSAQRLELQRLLQRHEKLGLQGAFLNFKEKDENFKENYCVFQDKAKYKNKQLNLKSQNNNLLIEGENYHALKALQQANVKVDIIYIDPPYNTGKEFIFNDKIIDPSDAYRHSKWLSFMKLRLEVAKELLNDNGVIFVSIDDNEQAYLKVLMDEIFGQNNFICNFDWISKPGGQPDNKFIARTKQYILMYKKNEFEIVQKWKTVKEKEIYGQDEKGKYIKSTELNATSGGSSKYAWARPNLAFHIYYNPKSRRIKFTKSWDQKKQKPILPEKIKGFFVASPKKDNTRWRWEKERIKKERENLIFEVKKNCLKVFKKEYVSDNKKKTFIRDNLIRDIAQSKGTIELKKILANSKLEFPYPKPTQLIRELINLLEKKDAMILDFFAGSGTTGHAVLALNEADKGNRRFILINEKKDQSTKEQKCIAQITYERLYRIIKGKGTNGESIEWELSSKKKAFLHASLRFLEIKYINKLNGQFEDFETPQIKSLYKTEFNHNIKIQDFRDND